MVIGHFKIFDYHQIFHVSIPDGKFYHHFFRDNEEQLLGIGIVPSKNSELLSISLSHFFL